MKTDRMVPLMSTASSPVRYLLHDGELIEYADAKMHVLSTSMKYGVGVFEGFRAYWSEEDGELYAFRVQDHMRRLLDSMRVVEIAGPADIDVLSDQLLGLVRANELRANLHMRAQVFVDSPDGKPDDTGPATVYMAAIPMGNYFGATGLDVQISSWARLSDRAMPPRIKSIANYQNGRLALLEARRNGYGAALLLTESGHVAEGAGYNVFMVRQGRLCTPPSTESILEGITRDSVLQLAATELGLDVDLRPIDRTELYSADEIFVCGSAAEVNHVTSVDRTPIGDGSAAGPITSQLQDLYQQAVRGRIEKYRDWVIPVYGAATR
ncbi:branched-chain amino acid transaminase [Microbacterium sp. SD291]|uniref:branched-chain amino acid transaminase n=1 Tax=Microbacterium sp. SD291 TaxID=2782007 RepID=UPI001A96425F|nr:branched-chain amino acid transaminase [Microbacterium sp. SD291]MBO0980078.1 branched-chain amino acid transaminase [Microbacterium sp. SD291]